MRNFILAALVALALVTPAKADTTQTITTLNHLFTFQVKMTGSAIALPLRPAVNGVTCAAKAGNAAPIVIGGTSAVTTTADGTGTGLILAAGSSAIMLVNGVLAGNQTAQVWVIGTANDVLSCWGN